MMRTAFINHIHKAMLLDILNVVATDWPVDE